MTDSRSSFENKSRKDHPLNSKWNFYMQVRGQNYDQYTDFKRDIDTVEEWWTWWNEMHGKTNSSLEKLKRAQLKLYMMRDDILPSWEHPKNAKGGILTLTCTLSDDKTIQEHDKHIYELWQKCAMSIVGETFYRQEKDYETLLPTGISVQFGKNNIVSIKIWFPTVWWSDKDGEFTELSRLPTFVSDAIEDHDGIIPTISQHKF